MATFVVLINLTDQGIRKVKESPNRYEAFENMAKEFGVTVKCAYYTVGQYDMVVIIEGEDKHALASMLTANTLGNVRSQTMLAYSVEAMKAITKLMP